MRGKPIDADAAAQTDRTQGIVVDVSVRHIPPSVYHHVIRVWG